MTRDEIIAMAREAELQYGSDESPLQSVVRFAALVAAAEREECAKLCEPSGEHRQDASWGYLGGEEGLDLLDGIAAAIRARGAA